MKEIKEHELIKSVFSNPQGDALLDFWEKVYGQRISYSMSNTPEQTSFHEGERNFYLSIKQLLEIKE